MIMKTNIIIGSKMGASPEAVILNLESGTITWGRSRVTTEVAPGSCEIITIVTLL
jgi:hypothetical protein